MKVQPASAPRFEIRTSSHHDHMLFAVWSISLGIPVSGYVWTREEAEKYLDRLTVKGETR